MTPMQSLQSLVGPVVQIEQVALAAAEVAKRRSTPAWRHQAIEMANLRRKAITADPAGERARARHLRAVVPARIWWTGFGIAFAMLIVGVSIMLPGKYPDPDPAVLMAVSVPSLTVATVAYLLLSIAPVPSSVNDRNVANALLPTGLVAPLMIWAVTRAAVGRDVLRDGVGPAIVVGWFVVAGLATIAAACFFARMWPRRAPAQERPGATRRAHDPAEAAAQAAERQVNGAPFGPGSAVWSRWSRAVTELDLEPEVRAQAKELGPYGYLVLSLHDSRLQLPSAETLPSDETLLRGPG